MKARLYTFKLSNRAKVMIVRKGIIEAVKAIPADLRPLVESMKSQPVTLGSKPTNGAIRGRWVFERSSGYAGYRCQECSTWIHENSEYKCKCDT